MQLTQGSPRCTQGADQGYREHTGCRLGPLDAHVVRTGGPHAHGMNISARPQVGGFWRALYEPHLATTLKWIHGSFDTCILYNALQYTIQG